MSHHPDVVGERDSMYQIQRAGRHAGREVVVVREDGRLVSGASLEFVNWLCERVPDRQLRPEQLALVRWCAARSERVSGLIG